MSIEIDRSKPEQAVAEAAAAYSNWDRWGADDVLGTLAYEPSSRQVVTEQRQPTFSVAGRQTAPFNADDLDIPAFLRDRR